MQEYPPQSFFVAGLTRTVTEKEVAEHFEKFGRGVRFATSRDDSGKSLGYGWLHFDQVNTSHVLATQHAINGAVLKLCVSQQKKQTPVPAEPAAMTPNVHKTTANIPTLKKCSDRGEKRERQDSDGVEACSFGNSSESPHTPQKYARTMKRTAEVNPRSYTEENNVAAVTNSNEYYQTKNVPKFCTTASQTFVCIPLQICPEGFLHDPRVFCCALNPTEVGRLDIVASPMTHRESGSVTGDPLAAMQDRGNARPSSASAHHAFGNSTKSAPHDQHSWSSSNVTPPPPPPPPGPPPFSRRDSSSGYREGASRNHTPPQPPPGYLSTSTHPSANTILRVPFIPGPRDPPPPGPPPMQDR